LGSFALPVAILPILMHRERLIETPTFHVIEAIALGVAALALLLSLGAFVRLWVTGDQGWGKAGLGLVFSLAVLAPVVIGIVVSWRYPEVTDVTTDPSEPPVLISGLLAPPQTPDLVARIRTAFPNVQTRTYPLDPAQLYAMAGALAQSQGWDIRLRREPQSATDEGQINAVATTLLGWRDEVSIRIRGEADGSRVDMRSAGLSGVPDLGANGRRVEEYLVALDKLVSDLLRDTPAAAAPAAEEADG
jgi:hypothetical protein